MIKYWTIIDPISGQPWGIQVVLTGDTYGRSNSIVNDRGPMVEFYDERRVSEGRDPYFVSRYYVETLKSDEYGAAHPGPYGLNLQGDSVAWSVSSEGMHLVMGFIDSVLAGVAA
jgi:hypothetical protein